MQQAQQQYTLPSATVAHAVDLKLILERAGDLGVDVHSADLAELDMLKACLDRVERWDPDQLVTHRHQVYCASRQPGGWLEFGLVLYYVGGKSIFVGAIQRQVGAEIEFHS